MTAEVRNGAEVMLRAGPLYHRGVSSPRLRPEEATQGETPALPQRRILP